MLSTIDDSLVCGATWWCTSADDLMRMVVKLWDIKYYKLQTNDVVNLYTDTWLVVRDEQ